MSTLGMVSGTMQCLSLLLLSTLSACLCVCACWHTQMDVHWTFQVCVKDIKNTVLWNIKIYTSWKTVRNTNSESLWVFNVCQISNSYVKFENQCLYHFCFYLLSFESIQDAAARWFLCILKFENPILYCLGFYVVVFWDYTRYL